VSCFIFSSKKAGLKICGIRLSAQLSSLVEAGLEELVWLIRLNTHFTVHMRMLMIVNVSFCGKVASDSSLIHDHTIHCCI
jgi:hypothetical protein